MNGIINILKPAGMTSHDVVNAMRRLLGIKRIGHTGTLDPMAVGVLPVCMGSATRIMEYLDIDYKKYRCEMQLGVVTDTEDIWGTVLDKKKVVIDGAFSKTELQDTEPGVIHVPEEALRRTAARYTGDIMQTPPDYSAVRVAGRRLYEYARSGESVKAAARRINVKSLDIINIDHEQGKVLFDIVSSKGSYIRTICTSIGTDLGCGAAMSFLARTACGRFLIDDSRTLEEIKEAIDAGLLATILLPADYPLVGYESLQVRDAARAQAFINGGPLDPDEVESSPIESEKIYKVYYGSQFIAMARFDQDRGKILSDKVFCRSLEPETLPDHKETLPEDKTNLES